MGTHLTELAFCFGQSKLKCWAGSKLGRQSWNLKPGCQNSLAVKFKCFPQISSNICLWVIWTNIFKSSLDFWPLLCSQAESQTSELQLGD